MLLVCVVEIATAFGTEDHVGALMTLERIHQHAHQHRDATFGTFHASWIVSWVRRLCLILLLLLLRSCTLLRARAGRGGAGARLRFAFALQLLDVLARM